MPHETKHDPGPWMSSRDAVPEGIAQHTVYCEATGNRVATVFGREANVPLVTAAPRLLAACQVISLTKEIRAWLKQNDPMALRQIERAIAAATGDE